MLKTMLAVYTCVGQTVVEVSHVCVAPRKLLFTSPSVSHLVLFMALIGRSLHGDISVLIGRGAAFSRSTAASCSRRRRRLVLA